MKGYAFTIDVTFGAVLALFLLVYSTSFMLTSYTSGIGDISVKRIAEDTITLLDYNGTLDSLDSGKIRSGIGHMLPPNLAMGVNITVYDNTFTPVQEVIIDYETERNRFAGRHCFMIFDGNRADGFAVADYWVSVG